MAKYYGEGFTKEICTSIEKLGYRHGTHTVFEDWLEICAISISNSVDWLHREKREARYLEIVKKYDAEDLATLVRMFSDLVNALEQQVPKPSDILGKVFHNLELHNKYKGQFFTPQNICDMMGSCTLSENDYSIETKGYISVCEPCAGSGAMILGLAKAMSDCKYNYTKQMVVTAIDVDLKCVFMTYIQLSLYGIPAVVIHGNSLTVQEWSRWHTPVYMLDCWILKQRCGMTEPTEPVEKEETARETSKAPHLEPPKYDVELKVDPNGQVSLF